MASQQPQGAWRTRHAPPGAGREYLRHILAWSNPVLPPVQQIPHAYGGPPPAEALKAYRQQLRAQLQDAANSGDDTARGLLDAGWLDDDPMDGVRQQLEEFLDGYDPHTFAVAPDPAQVARMDQALAAASDPYRYTPPED